MEVITSHAFWEGTTRGYCGVLVPQIGYPPSPCGAHRDLHADVLSQEGQQVRAELARRIKPMVTLPSGPPVRSDYERALERIRELEDREKANAGHFQTVWDQLTEQKLLRDANEERIRELEAEITSLKSQRQVLIDSERSLSIKLSMESARARNLQDELYYSEEERLKAAEEAGNLRLRLDESLAREGALNQRLSNLDTLAREVSARVEKMLGSVDKPSSVA